jgi:hypothetical protein
VHASTYIVECMGVEEKQGVNHASAAALCWAHFCNHGQPITTDSVHIHRAKVIYFNPCVHTHNWCRHSCINRQPTTTNGAYIQRAKTLFIKESQYINPCTHCTSLHQQAPTR